MATCAAGLDGTTRPVLHEHLGDLGPGAVSGAEEQHLPPATAGTVVVNGRRRERQPGMQRTSDRSEQAPAAKEIGSVVHVATVGRAPARPHDATASQFTQVVRDHVLRFADALHELTHAPVAATQLADQMPPERISQQTEDARRLRRDHFGIISN
jgi:hypothetical protein